MTAIHVLVRSNLRLFVVKDEEEANIYNITTSSHVR
eukprot:CAMPEP_0113586838 /NCGR_PEP_ID=MMETSP0015_2-20120614/34533_1 /TAXON_ID=2838 /ORGANISM="Odontella" /LENGTH=35 /DNA_ID=CAMNT_0000492347 /DNA_START=96 /DNA_END=199 /DNA_ORIENTATION=- /assembly_acc=CAM_ASM_000160